MRYEWDEQKNAKNLEKHGILFEAIEAAQWEQAWTLMDERKDYGETRLLAYVPINGRLHAALYVKRGEVRRMISLRKANPRERRLYEKNTKKS